jgi:glycosyltransferase involved in cell wall biosynthesis
LESNIGFSGEASMSKVCFVSFEIHPVTVGGCGVLLYNSAHVLLEQGHQVILLLDMPKDRFDKFSPDIYPNSHNCKAYHLEELCIDLPYLQEDFLSFHIWRSYRFHWAVQKMVDLEQPDVVEFFDYNGVAHYALSAKITQAAYKDTHLAVRLHNSDQLMNLHQPFSPLTHDYYLLYALEHSALRFAETVLFPSQAYLNEAYKPYYEPWLGRLVHSKPAVVHYPQLHDSQKERDVVLFYGRLFGFKGVDLFVDAAVNILSEGNYRDLCFVLAGYDSHTAPDGSDTYRDYLLKRVPGRYRSQFDFVGQLSWKQLEDLLPKVWCAVFPGYFESFCYAAHELYAAGIPVIVNDIPSFRDYFKHGQNALVFDGTVRDLTQQIKTLWQDKELRERIRRPYSVSNNPLGSFYEGPFNPTWIKLDNRPNEPLSALICILDEGKYPLGNTIQSLKTQNVPNMRVVILKTLPNQTDTESGAIWFLGDLYTAVDLSGKQIRTMNLHTEDTFLILRAGDVVLKDYLAICLSALARQPELSFVGCWKHIHNNGGVKLDTFPIDAALELIPFYHLLLLNRVVMRTEPGRLLVDLFDPRLMHMGEVGYLWNLEAIQGPGVLIPECLIECYEDDFTTQNANLLSYLVLKDSYKERKTRLANYLLTVWTALDDSLLPPSQTTLAQELAATVKAIEVSKVGQIMSHYPFILTGIKRILRWFRRR